MSSDPAPRRYRAGDTVEDLCRACKIMRVHTVMSVDGAGAILRVVCDYCKSHHNWRGGEERDRKRNPPPGRRAPRSSAASGAGEPFPLVSLRERRHPVDETIGAGGAGLDLELLLRRVIREELGLTPAVPADKWRGGTLVLRPGREGLQDKSWPIETFFHKVVMLRNRLRVLEQQIGAADVPDELKTKLLGYITGCYGTLTSFNVLFADEDDQFHGAGGKD